MNLNEGLKCQMSNYISTISLPLLIPPPLPPPHAGTVCTELCWLWWWPLVWLHTQPPQRTPSEQSGSSTWQTRWRGEKGPTLLQRFPPSRSYFRYIWGIRRCIWLMIRTEIIFERPRLLYFYRSESVTCHKLLWLRSIGPKDPFYNPHFVIQTQWPSNVIAFTLSEPTLCPNILLSENGHSRRSSESGQGPSHLITNFRKSFSHNFYTYLIVCPTNLSMNLEQLFNNGAADPARDIPI